MQEKVGIFFLALRLQTLTLPIMGNIKASSHDLQVIVDGARAEVVRATNHTIDAINKIEKLKSEIRSTRLEARKHRKSASEAAVKAKRAAKAIPAAQKREARRLALIKKVEARGAARKARAESRAAAKVARDAKKVAHAAAVNRTNVSLRRLAARGKKSKAGRTRR